MKIGKLAIALILVLLGMHTCWLWSRALGAENALAFEARRTRALEAALKDCRKSQSASRQEH